MSSSGVKLVAQPTLDWPWAVSTAVPAGWATHEIGVTVQSLLKLMLEQRAEQSDMVAVVVRLALGEETEEAEGVTSEVRITVVVEAAECVSDEGVADVGVILVVIMNDDTDVEGSVERLGEEVTDAAERAEEGDVEKACWDVSGRVPNGLDAWRDGLLEELVDQVVRDDQDLQLAAGSRDAAVEEADRPVDQTCAAAAPRSTSAHSQSGCVSGGP